MLKSFRKSFATIVATLALAIVPALVVAPAAFAVSENIDGALKCGANLELNPNGTGCDVTTGSTGLTNIVRDIINIFSVIVGIVSVIMIIYGGFRYVTSGGDSGNVGNAKNTIIYAVVGLIVVALAQFIVQFVLEKVTGAGV